MVGFKRPESVLETVKLLRDEDSIVFSGGTDLMVKRKMWSGVTPRFEKPVVSIGHLSELKGICLDENYLRIGSACTYTDVQENELVPEYLKAVIAEIASPAIRNVGTIGGNICNASPAGDILPPLYALGAVLVLKRIDGVREVEIDKFILGPGRTDIKRDEILTEILIPKGSFDKYFYKKVGTRKSTALAKLSFMGLANVVNGRVENIAISFGAVAPTIVRSVEAEKNIIGKNIEEINLVLQKLEDEYSGLINPISDQRSSAAYRKKVALNLLKKFLGTVQG